jgi:hypothetical protein
VRLATFAVDSAIRTLTDVPGVFMEIFERVLSCFSVCEKHKDLLLRDPWGIQFGTILPGWQPCQV